MRRLLFVLFAAAMLAVGSPQDVRAAAADYAFEAVTPQVPRAGDAVISVRLVNTATGAPVANAVIFQTRLDMSPEGMGEMAAPVTPLDSASGVYRFKADLDMQGRWSLKLAAKVPGEQDTVRGEVLVLATKPAAKVHP